MLIQKIKNLFKDIKPQWFLICAGYLLFIFIFSWLYPYGKDEYFSQNYGDLKNTLDRMIRMFLYRSPKISVFIGSFVLIIGRWFFLMVNPLVQFATLISAFYFIYLRLPDFKSNKDIYVFILLAVLSVFAVATPDNTIFWLGGAIAYSWAFFLFLFALCVLRALYAGKPLFNDTRAAKILAFFFSVCLGMTNENNAPMALIIMLCFYAWAVYKKTKLPKWFYFALAGLITGIAIMFGSPAHGHRLGQEDAFFADFSMSQRIFFHIGHMHGFITRSLVIPAAVFIPLFICSADPGKKPFRNETFLLALATTATAWILAAVLFLAPEVWRAFYSASYFSIISFILIFKYIEEEYRLNFLKYFSMAAVIGAAVILPLFAIPYISLHKQAAMRQERLDETHKLGRDYVFLPLYVVQWGPSQNLTIRFFDALNAPPGARLHNFRLKAGKIPIVPAHYEDSEMESVII